MIVYITNFKNAKPDHPIMGNLSSDRNKMGKKRFQMLKLIISYQL